jgi:hypothetical protein
VQIPLSVLLAVVVLGVGLVVGLTWALGWGAEAELQSADQALDHWHATHPERPAVGALVDDRRRAALIEINSENTGLVFVHGDKLVARYLPPGSVRSVELRGSTLTLRLSGFARATVELELADPVARSAWHSRLSHRC